MTGTKTGTNRQTDGRKPGCCGWADVFVWARVSIRYWITRQLGKRWDVWHDDDGSRGIGSSLLVGRRDDYYNSMMMEPSVPEEWLSKFLNNKYTTDEKCEC